MTVLLLCEFKTMGATGWQYFVPYQANVEAALQRLRGEVFAREE